MNDIFVVAYPQNKYFVVYSPKTTLLAHVHIIYTGPPLNLGELVALAKLYGVNEIIDWRPATRGGAKYYNWRAKQ